MNVTQSRSAAPQFEKELRARVKQQAAVAELGRLALEGAELSALMDEAVRLIARTLGVSSCEVLELLPGGGGLLLRAGVGWGRDLVGSATIETDAGSQVGHALLGAEPVIVNDLRREKRFKPPPLLVEHGVVSCMSVRIGGRDGPFGVLCTHDTARRAFTHDDAHFLKSAANVLAAAVTRKRAEERIRTTLESIGDGFLACDSEWRFVYVNAEAERLLGIRREEVLGRSHWEVFPLTLGTRVEREYRRAAAGEGRDFENLYEPWGRWFHIRCFPREGGGMSVYFQEITERKRAEEALRESEKRFRATFEQAAVGIAHLAPDGRWLMMNQKLCDIVGYTREELLTKSFQEITYAADLDADVESAGRLLAGEIDTYALEKRYLRKDGSAVWINLTVSLVKDDATGEPLYFIAVAEDINARKLAEERIREQAALLDVAQDAILVRDLEDRILYWNRGAERLYGWTAAEAVGRPADRLLYREPSPQLGAAHRALLRRGEWQGEIHQVTKDGRDVTVESRWSFVRDESGSPRAKLIVNTDVTEKRKLLAELARASHLSLIGELAAGLAHEIKNPLAGIKGAVDILIQRRQQQDPEVAVLEDVRHAVERIDATVRALLERARPRPPRLTAASLVETVRGAVLLARHHAANSAAARVEVVFEPPRDDLVLPLDPAQVEDAVLNLILNGIEAAAGGGRVVVNVRRRKAPAEAVVEVSDTGRGIAAGDLGRVFSPFYTTTEGGTGLGLPSVRRTARAHGGRVEVCSEPGRGSTFTLHLPLPAEP